jgi:type II secretory pathway component PulJ
VQSLLTTIGAVVALVAASVGVMAAIEQLTLRARLRRTAELAQALSAQENDSERQTVLRSIHDVAVARLVSGWLLPYSRATR